MCGGLCLGTTQRPRKRVGLIDRGPGQCMLLAADRGVGGPCQWCYTWYFTAMFALSVQFSLEVSATTLAARSKTK